MKKVIFNQIPSGFPVAGETLKLVNTDIDLDAPLNGGILVKVLVLSLDPYLRGKMRDSAKKSYTPAYEIGQTLSNYGVVRVLRSEHPDYPEGAHLYSQKTNFEEYFYVSKDDIAVAKYIRLDDVNKETKLPWSQFLGAAGMPGKTAAYGFSKIADAKPGETIFISSASGAVGSMVGQLAKERGLFVIGSAGNDAKVQFLKELGFDHAFNYKTHNLDEELTKLGRPIDINWEHVGTETLDTLLTHMNVEGRVILCGLIDSYNGKQYAYKNVPMILAKSIKMQGFIILRHADFDPEFYATVPKMIASKQLVLQEDITDGLDSVEKAFLGLLEGKNHGKVIIRLAA